MSGPFPIDSYLPLRSTDYFYFLHEQIEQAQHRIWASMFTINVNLRDDGSQVVRRILKLLSAAHHRSVDTRLLLGASEEDLSELTLANRIAASFLRSFDLPVRSFSTTGQTTSHSKYVIFDERLVILGSHNWSPRSFTRGIDDSLALFSRPMAASLGQQFLNAWGTSKSIQIF